MLGARHQEIPDAIEPIYGIRTWVAIDAELRSHNSQYFWDLGTNIAQCVYAVRNGDNHLPPISGCSCGFYSYNFANSFRLWSTIGVAGIVALTGQVIIHERGYRAEKAEIKALFHSGLDLRQTRSLTSQDIATIAKAYNVPLLPLLNRTETRGPIFEGHLPVEELKKLGIA